MQQLHNLEPEQQALQIISELREQGESYAQIGRNVGMTRAAISQFHHGRYPARTTHGPVSKILKTYGNQLVCPWLGESLKETECKNYRNKPMPTSDPWALKHWSACKRCMFNPEMQKKQEHAA